MAPKHISAPHWTTHVSPAGLRYSVDSERIRVLDIDHPATFPEQRFPSRSEFRAGTGEYWISNNAVLQRICHLTRECFPNGHPYPPGTRDSAKLYWQFRESHPDHMIATKLETDMAILILTMDCTRSVLGVGKPQWADGGAVKVLKLLERAEDGATRTCIVASVLRRAVDDAGYNHRLQQLKTDADQQEVSRPISVRILLYFFYLVDIAPFCGIANLYFKRLRTLHRTRSQSGDSISKYEWRMYVNTLVKEWTDANLLATVLIAATVSLLAVDNATEDIQVVLFLSILAGVGSVFVGMFYVWQHQNHRESSGEVGAVYLKRAESIIGATYTFSLLLALPLVLLLWALIAFVLSVVLLVGGFKSAPDGSPGAVAQRVVSSVGVVLFLCVVTALACFWSIWTHHIGGAAPPKPIYRAYRLMTILGLVAAILGFNTGFGFWVYYYIRAGTDPNPRTAVNKTHAVWTTFSAALPLAGFVLLFLNAYIWRIFFRSKFGFGLQTQQTTCLQSNVKSRALPLKLVRSISTAVWKPSGLLHERLSWFWHHARVLSNLLVFLPIAVVMTVGPFIVPFAAMPIAQQWAWDHRCESWDMTVLLHGRNSTSFSSATVQFKNGGGYTYDLRDGNSVVYRWTGLVANADPTLQNVTYDLATSAVTGYCQSVQQQCLSGRMDQDLDSLSYLTFNFTANLGFGNRTSYLQAVDHDWRYSNDAPSLLLRDQVTQKDVMRTVVTKRGDCTQLKMCANWFGEADLLVPVGRILIEQERWAVGSTCGPKRP